MSCKFRSFLELAAFLDLALALTGFRTGVLCLTLGVGVPGFGSNTPSAINAQRPRGRFHIKGRSGSTTTKGALASPQPLPPAAVGRAVEACYDARAGTVRNYQQRAAPAQCKGRGSYGPKPRAFFLLATEYANPVALIVGFKSVKFKFEPQISGRFLLC